MNVLKSVQNELAQRRKALEDVLVEGRAEDYAVYKGLAGEIRGLSFAEMLINDLVRKLENDDE